MRISRSTLLFFFFGILLMILACGSVWIAGFVVMGIPEATEKLGPVTPDLNPVQQTVLALYLLANESALDAPAGDPGTGIELVVEPGDSATVVVDQLQAAGLVQNSFLLRSYLRYRGLDVGIEAGYYKLHGGMTVRELAESLQTAMLSEAILTILEGWRIEEIAAAIPSSGLTFDPVEFLNIANSRPIGFPFTERLPPEASHEGYLLPDTYVLDPESGALDVVLKVLHSFESQVSQDLRDGFNQHGLSLHEAVTLASIVEREAVVSDEQPTIASVFLNRLALGMNLDADPTVQYALGKQADGWWKAPLNRDDLEIESLYNTYKYPGLPPGPIANPGLSALRAVAFPQDTPYLYFRALCDGSGLHAFAVTLEEHLQNACP
jgi:UPF0755 protein